MAPTIAADSRNLFIPFLPMRPSSDTALRALREIEPFASSNQEGS
jgi:hypothetical protein